MVAPQVVVIDELGQALFELTWQVVGATETSSGVTECDSCTRERRDVRVPAQTPAHRTIATEVTKRALKLRI